LFHVIFPSLNPLRKGFRPSTEDSENRNQVNRRVLAGIYPHVSSMS
jgi:hypothetical protein